ncbi:hypothetical protein HN695_00790 [Candidatus Woesearchaeota archaeon]|jgi:hypothetical protein|nr:hypothetical protein [Candidatus Woesearchaeota archaeon]MBT5272790.1 hypothetical protein [Candidatus Woesearchaeota archaeon]MBT6040402.1 hypothetical protein [Candidatus Woesearchaeota archaeon]MBT6336965.1 hypothetical protein [Candidatus Woesearchaeota archaeon]MBT7926851.1 hypothetical protein [Candidatus Woesearchaeota archaeon]
MIKDTPEQHFFKYAWPCTEIILTDKRIPQQRFDDLKYAIENNITPSREILEDTYKVAFANLKELAERLSKEQNKEINYWDMEVIQRYFTEAEHNMFIESEKAFFCKFPPAVKDLCKIHTAVIDKIEVISDRIILFVKYKDDKGEEKERRCLNIYNLEIKPQDKVIIHYGYIIEKA